MDSYVAATDYHFWDYHHCFGSIPSAERRVLESEDGELWKQIRSAKMGPNCHRDRSNRLWSRIIVLAILI